MPINTSNAIQESKVKLFVTQVIREDANLLFGFMDTIREVGGCFTTLVENFETNRELFFDELTLA